MTVEPEHHVVYRVYDDEESAAQAAQLLVEAGFPPQDVYVGVEREGQLRRAYTGWGVRLGIAASFGAAISCAIGMTLVMAASVGLISLPMMPVSNQSAMSAASLSIFPCAIPGAILGWLVAALLWNRGAPNFPAHAHRPAFVGVEVGPGNMTIAEMSMMHAHTGLLAQEADWPKLASEAMKAA